jgi:hypothetical protein
MSKSCQYPTNNSKVCVGLNSLEEMLSILTIFCNYYVISVQTNIFYN